MAKYLNKQSGKLCEILIDFPMYEDRKTGLETETRYIFVHCDRKKDTYAVIMDVEGVIEVKEHLDTYIYVKIDARYDRQIVADNIEEMLTM